MTVYVVCKPLGMIYAVHDSESAAIEDCRRRNYSPGSNKNFKVEQWTVLSEK